VFSGWYGPEIPEFFCCGIGKKNIGIHGKERGINFFPDVDDIGGEQVLFRLHGRYGETKLPVSGTRQKRGGV